MRSLFGVCAALGVLLVAGGCDPGPSATAGDEGPATTVAALCATVAAGDDPAAAEEVFYAQAHRPLHDIARDLEAQDRAAAATLLRAKNALESAFADDAPSGPVIDRARALVTATRDGLTALGVETAPCA